MIHHQHYFPVVGDDGKLKPAFLAVTNMQPEKPEVIARNSERVLVARLRDARFFYDEDRKAPLASRLDALSTILLPQVARQLPREGGARGRRWRAGSRTEALEQPGDRRLMPRWPGASARPTSPPTWCASSRNCRAPWAASTPARKACPRRCGRPSITTTCRSASKRTRRRRRQTLGAAAITWAAVSLADKLDSVVGDVRGRGAAHRVARSAGPAPPRPVAR